ncbi:Synaptotagmin-like mitochondrial-lipid-binding domain [Sesbania bispinosa]|nr:Synaptotagmin-like mitochondrial-lipid-binding domain [Sesbania bispinosa]
MVLVFALILFGFLLGVVAVLAAEALGLLWILKRLRSKMNRDQAKISSKTQLGSAQIDPHQSFKKEGVVWILEPDKVSKLWVEKSSKEQKRKKELIEVSPVRKYGKINGQSFVLTEPDGFHTTIQLKGCLIEAVSATSLPSKKWAKKFPIKVETKTSVIYQGSKTLYIYLETSSEKEAWCKALRLASCDQKEKLEWFVQLQEDFHSYLTSLNTEYHSFMKTSVGSNVEAIERASKSDGTSSKRTLSNMRTPSYVGEVICTDINLGNVPPCIIGMRVLPMEMSEVCALEVDIEYSGSAVLEIETRLEVGELELHRGTEGSNPESSNVGAVPSDLLEGFEYFGKQLNLAEGVNDLQVPKEDGDGNTDVSKSFKNNSSSSTHGSRWKSMISSVANKFSQVPLSLAIRVASLRGTLRLQIKPPPSDQLWYGFTFMPDIDFNLESYFGEHKITYSQIALFLVNRLKAAIRDTLVLPNSESISIPWMLAEKDDWVPRSVAPFIWINQESGNETSTSSDTNNQPSVGVKASARTSCDGPELKQQKLKSSESSQEPPRKSDSVALPSSSSSSITLRSSKSLDELTKPLLENDKPQETRDLKELRSPSLQIDNTNEISGEKVEDISVCESPSRGMVMDKSISLIEQDDSRPKKIGRRERMLDLRKKMSEKFEEKKRHIEEKGRHIVEKMRGP